MPVVQVGKIEECAGGAGNVALNIVALGSCVTLLGITGDDDPSAVLESRLSAAGVACEFVHRVGQECHQIVCCLWIGQFVHGVTTVVAAHIRNVRLKFAVDRDYLV